MDFGGDGLFNGGGNVAPDGGGGGFDNWGGQGFSDQGVWATEDEYRNWNENPSYSSSQNHSGSEPPNKKTRISQQGGDAQVIITNRSKAIGKMFFKTKLCCKFRAGVCPYITNCNFAHGIEELRKPPPNWQEIVAAHEGEYSEPREEHQIPIIRSPDLRGESQRSYKGRHCKKFYTDEGCPYGENCTFLHDEQSRARESVAISVTPTANSGYGNNVPGQNQKPSNWKTRICNKWETTGYCPFGSKCHFAHGAAELHKYGGGLVELDSKDGMAATPDTKVGGVTGKGGSDMMVPSTLLPLHADSYHMGLGLGNPLQRPSSIIERPGRRWKGPDTISKVYGDWIDDFDF